MDLFAKPDHLLAIRGSGWSPRYLELGPKPPSIAALRLWLQDVGARMQARGLVLELARSTLGAPTLSGEALVTLAGAADNAALVANLQKILGVQTFSLAKMQALFCALDDLVLQAEEQTCAADGPEKLRLDADQWRGVFEASYHGDAIIRIGSVQKEPFAAMPTLGMLELPTRTPAPKAAPTARTPDAIDWAEALRLDPRWFIEAPPDVVAKPEVVRRYIAWIKDGHEKEFCPRPPPGAERWDPALVAEFMTCAYSQPDLAQPFPEWARFPVAFDYLPRELASDPLIWLAWKRADPAHSDRFPILADIARLPPGDFAELRREILRAHITRFTTFTSLASLRQALSDSQPWPNDHRPVAAIWAARSDDSIAFHELGAKIAELQRHGFRVVYEEISSLEDLLAADAHTPSPALRGLAGHGSVGKRMVLDVRDNGVLRTIDFARLKAAGFLSHDSPKTKTFLYSCSSAEGGIDTANLANALAALSAGELSAPVLPPYGFKLHFVDDQVDQIGFTRSGTYVVSGERAEVIP